MQHPESMSASQAATPSLAHRYQSSRPWSVGGLVMGVSAGAVFLAGAVSYSLPEPALLIPAVARLADDLAPSWSSLIQAGRVLFR